MKKYITLKQEFVMTNDEVEQYELLPDNLPGNKLTTKQIDFVSSLYYKYISKIDNLDWSPRLVDIEMKEKWPSGLRIKRHEAQRIILNNLVSENARKRMTKDQAVSHFFSAMTCRPAYVRLVSKIWNL